MPGPICKHYYDNGLAAFAEANAAAIRDAEARGLIKPERAHELFDKMAAIETIAYQSLRAEITAPLIEMRLVSPKVWEMWAKPE